MGKSQRIRLREVRAIDQLVFECLELWADPQEWRHHLVRGIYRIAQSGLSGCDHRALRPDKPQGLPVGSASFGWNNDHTRNSFHQAMEGEPGAVGMPNFERVIKQLFEKGRATAWRGDVVDEPEFRRSDFFQGVFEPHGVADGIVSMRWDPRPGHFMFISVNRFHDDPPFQPRQRTLLRLVHDAIMPYVGKRLALEGQASMHGLTPRRREALQWLLDGISERELAQRMGISHATAHQYVGDLYRHFNVNTRAELMAYFIHRHPR